MAVVVQINTGLDVGNRVYFFDSPIDWSVLIKPRSEEISEPQ